MPNFETKTVPESPPAGKKEQPEHSPDTSQERPLSEEEITRHLEAGMQSVNELTLDPDTAAENAGVELSEQEKASYKTAVDAAKDSVRAAQEQVWSSTDRTLRARDNAESVSRRMEEYRGRIAKLEEEIAALDSRLNEKKSSFINRVVKFKSIQRLELQREGKIADKEGYRNILREDEDLKKFYETIIVEEEGRERILQEETLARESAEKERIALEQSEREARDIRNLSEEFGCFFVHDIVDAEWKPSDNNQTLDTRRLSWTDQLDILHGLEPTISASTLKEGSQQKTFAKNGSWGVFLRGGEALGGGYGDIGSRAVGLREREINTADQGIEVIRRGISERGDESHNEIIVSRPEIAGAYLRTSLKDLPPMSADRRIILADDVDEYGDTKIGWKRMRSRFREIVERKMTTCILTENNEAFIVSIEDNSDEHFTIVLAEAHLNPQDMMNMPGIYQADNSADARRRSVHRVIDKVQHVIPEDERKLYE